MIIILAGFNSFEQKGVEEDVQSLLKKFVVNNLRSGNLGSLIKVFLMRSGELHASAQCQKLVQLPDMNIKTTDK